MCSEYSVPDYRALYQSGLQFLQAGRRDEALLQFGKVILAKPDLAEAWWQAALIFLETDRFPEALRHAAKAVDLRPEEPTVWATWADAVALSGDASAEAALLDRLKKATLPPAFRLRLQDRFGAQRKSAKGATGKATRAQLDAIAALIGRGAFAKAEVAAARLTQEAPDSAVAFNMRGVALAAQGKAEAALAAFQGAVRADPFFADAFFNMARELVKLDRRAEAERMLRTAIARAPAMPQALLLYGEILIEDRRAAAAVNVLRRAVAVEGRNAKALLHLGRALNDLRDHAGALSVLHRARLAEVEMTQTAFRGLNLPARRVEGASEAAPIFVTGMPRSGTTLIEQIIASHSRVTGGDEMDILPRLCTPLQRNPDLPTAFRRADTIPDAEIAALGRDYLAAVATRFPGAGIVSDKSITSYMYLGLLKLALPKARVIVVRRDPRDNLLSIYRNRFPEGAHLYAYDLRALAEYYATFVQMVEFWRSETPDWFTEVQYESLVSNPEEESRRLIAACGLDWEEACLTPHHNERQVRTLSVYQVRQPISKGSVKAWHRYEEELQPMFDVLRERGLLPD
jgi:tetratricopeptide (TPR) repeat protein